MTMTKTKAKHISRTIYIIAATALLTAIGTGLFFERYKLQSPLLIQLQSPVVERELISPIVEKVGAKEVLSNDTGRSTEALRGEDEVEPAKADIQRITEFRGISIPQAVAHALAYYSDTYEVDYNSILKIARCESGFIPTITGPTEDGGILQFIPGTWIETRQRMGLDTDLELRYDLEENVKTGAWKMSKDGYGAWYSSIHCHGIS